MQVRVGSELVYGVTEIEMRDSKLERKWRFLRGGFKNEGGSFADGSLEI